MATATKQTESTRRGQTLRELRDETDDDQLKAILNRIIDAQEELRIYNDTKKLQKLRKEGPDK